VECPKDIRKDIIVADSADESVGEGIVPSTVATNHKQLALQESSSRMMKKQAWRDFLFAPAMSWNLSARFWRVRVGGYVA
jgi:hypothetical protein